MTVVFKGHVQSVEWFGAATVRVLVHAEQSVCPQPIYLLLPETDRTHWLPGRCVSITAFCFDVPKPGESPKD